MYNHLKISILSILLLMPLCSSADNIAQMFTQANTAYDSGNYEDAAAIYSEIISLNCSDWELYYNLANAYYRLDETGLSILNYRRALRLAPNNKLIKDNLALARSKTSDNIEQLPQPFLKQWTHAVVSITTPRGWRIVLLVIVFLLCAALTFFFIAHNYQLRKTMFIISTLLLILALFSAINAAISLKNVTNISEAVITAPMTIVKSSPDAKSLDKFILHEGTEVSINDSQDDWWQITIADGKTGWINGGAEKI